MKHHKSAATLVSHVDIHKFGRVIHKFEVSIWGIQYPFKATIHLSNSKSKF